jgi:hypothetical protein
MECSSCTLTQYLECSSCTLPQYMECSSCTLPQYCGPQEFESALTALNNKRGLQLTVDEMKRYFHEADEDDNGKIDYQEFLKSFSSESRSLVSRE